MGGGTSLSIPLVSTITIRRSTLPPHIYTHTCIQRCERVSGCMHRWIHVLGKKKCSWKLIRQTQLIVLYESYGRATVWNCLTSHTLLLASGQQSRFHSAVTSKVKTHVQQPCQFGQPFVLLILLDSYDRRPRRRTIIHPCVFLYVRDPQSGPPPILIDGQGNQRLLRTFH